MRIRKHIGYRTNQRINNFDELDRAKNKQEELYMIVFDGQPLNLNQDIAKAPQGNINILTKCERWFRRLFKLPIKNSFIQLELGQDLTDKTIRKNNPLDIQTDIERYIKENKNTTPVWTDPEKAKEYTIAIQLEYMKRAQILAENYARKTSKRDGLPERAIRIKLNYLPLPRLCRMNRAVPKTTKAYKKYKKEMRDFQ